jgi:hypothetical protein
LIVGEAGDSPGKLKFCWRHNKNHPRTSDPSADKNFVLLRVLRGEMREFHIEARFVALVAQRYGEENPDYQSLCGLCASV